MLKQEVFNLLLTLAAALLVVGCDAVATDTHPADGDVHSGCGEKSFQRFENTSVIAEEFSHYAVASVGTVVTIILSVKFLALYTLLLPSIAGTNAKFYFTSSMVVILVSGVTLPIALWILFFCIYLSVDNCPLKGSERSHPKIVTSNTQAGNGGGSVGLRRSKRKGIQHGRDRDDDDNYNRDPNPKKGRLSKYHPKRCGCCAIWMQTGRDYNLLYQHDSQKLHPGNDHLRFSRYVSKGGFEVNLAEESCICRACFSDCVRMLVVVAVLPVGLN